MVTLRISYRVRLHNLARFEQVFREGILPIIRDLRLPFRSLSRAVVGNAGEYLELWEFDSVGHFDAAWKTLNSDARLLKVFETTGPMVEDENWALFEPVIEERMKDEG